MIAVQSPLYAPNVVFIRKNISIKFLFLYFDIFSLSSTREYFLALDIERRINVIGRYREAEASRVSLRIECLYATDAIFNASYISTRIAVYGIICM